DLDVPVGEPVRHQAAELVAAARLLGRGLAVLVLQRAHETVQRPDDDGPAAVRVRVVAAVLVGGAPVHAGGQVEQEDGLLLAVGAPPRRVAAGRGPGLGPLVSGRRPGSGVAAAPRGWGLPNAPGWGVPPNPPGWGVPPNPPGCGVPPTSGGNDSVIVHPLQRA